MRNRAVRSELKTAVREAREAVEAGNGAEAYAAGLKASRLLDKAASKGIIHKNQAANRKSNLMKLVNTVATNEDRAAYQPVKHENVVKGGTKKAAAKAERQAAMQAAQQEKDKRRAPSSRRPKPPLPRRRLLPRLPLPPRSRPRSLPSRHAFHRIRTCGPFAYQEERGR